jgi:hypothetical protein
MRYILVAILIGVTCCSGCMTQTITSKEDGKVVSKRTIWIWQKDFWKQ